LWEIEKRKPDQERKMVYRRLSETEFEDIASRILYEDNHMLIFNKRSGEIVQGDKTGDEPLSETLKAFVAQRDSKPGMSSWEYRIVSTDR